MKRFILSELFFLVLYVGSYFTLYFTGAFERKSNIAAICLVVFHTISAMISMKNDFTPEGKYRPTVRTIGLYVLGIAYLLSFFE